MSHVHLSHLILGWHLILLIVQVMFVVVVVHVVVHLIACCCCCHRGGGGRRRLSIMQLVVLVQINQVLHVLDGHLYDLCLLYSSASLLHVSLRNQFAQVGQTIVHPISATLLDDPVRGGIFFLHSRASCSCSKLAHLAN